MQHWLNQHSFLVVAAGARLLLATSLGFEFTPTFILFDANDQERWRSVYTLDPAKLQVLLGLD